MLSSVAVVAVGIIGLRRVISSARLSPATVLDTTPLASRIALMSTILRPPLLKEKS
jgi:hypothetical protein